MTAVSVLQAYAAVHLEPTNEMPEHRGCLKLLAQMTDLLNTGDAVVPRITILRQITHMHHDKFISVYGWRAAKIKAHLTDHIPDCIAHFKRNLNCFPMERKHGYVKEACLNRAGANVHPDLVLKRMLTAMFTDYEDLEFVPNFLISPLEALVLQPVLRELMPDIGMQVHASKKMRMRVEGAPVNSGDLLLIKGERIGKAILFASANALGSATRCCFVFCTQYHQESADIWECSDTCSLFVVEDVIAVIPFLPINRSKIRPLLPFRGGDIS